MSNGILHIKLRTATAGYTLQKLSVDYSPGYKATLAKYHLALYGVKNAVLAPGYQLSTQSA